MVYLLRHFNHFDDKNRYFACFSNKIALFFLYLIKNGLNRASKGNKLPIEADFSCRSERIYIYVCKSNITPLCWQKNHTFGAAT